MMHLLGEGINNFGIVPKSEPYLSIQHESFHFLYKP